MYLVSDSYFIIILVVILWSACRSTEHVGAQ